MDDKEKPLDPAPEITQDELEKEAELKAAQELEEAELEEPQEPIEVQSVRHIPFLGKIAGAKDERTYWSIAVGRVGRDSLWHRGWHKLVLPLMLAISVSIMGYAVVGYPGIAFGVLFLIANLSVQLIANPTISEMRAQGLSSVWPTLVSLGAFSVLLISGTFAATLVAWYLFSPTVDQRHRAEVAGIMQASQEKQDLTFAESALERERTSILQRQNISTAGIEAAAKRLTEAQEAVVTANKLYQEELSKGRAGRRPGDGPFAKGQFNALQLAQAAEERAKKALDDARQQASVAAPVPEALVAAYNQAKGRYEAKEKALIDAGPGLLKTFWWLLGILHTEPLLFAFLVGWAFLEALPILLHAVSGRNIYERVRAITIRQDAEHLKEMRRQRVERVRARAEHRADMVRARREAKETIREAKDKSRH